MFHTFGASSIIEIIYGENSKQLSCNSFIIKRYSELRRTKDGASRTGR
ncbi:hypothetical protein HW278_08380 [Capnocytophaga sp. oral taxon 902]|nr:hypothetical protein [Capnocytophaga sp. oral taxon 902]QLF50712.1 hypothetical protein HW278_08380 [Capnocytophaga sp. oral taxon 902]